MVTPHSPDAIHTLFVTQPLHTGNYKKLTGHLNSVKILNLQGIILGSSYELMTGGRVGHVPSSLFRSCINGTEVNNKCCTGNVSAASRET